jgi:hypothetical protein
LVFTTLLLKLITILYFAQPQKLLEISIDKFCTKTDGLFEIISQNTGDFIVFKSFQNLLRIEKQSCHEHSYNLSHSWFDPSNSVWYAQAISKLWQFSEACLVILNFAVRLVRQLSSLSEISTQLLISQLSGWLNWLCMLCLQNYLWNFTIVLSN